jgi:hypothetical protein
MQLIRTAPNLSRIKVKMTIVSATNVHLLIFGVTFNPKGTM